MGSSILLILLIQGIMGLMISLAVGIGAIGGL